MLARWNRLKSLCATLMVTLALATAPAIEAVKHGPAVVAAEADHRAFHAEHGHFHGVPASDHHDTGDHDHVGAAVLSAPGADLHPAPERTLRPDAEAAAGTIRDGPRRPPRLTVI